VLFYNPRSGGGKAARFALAAEAKARGIEPVELSPGKNLDELVLDAVSRGADALAMAGGDGSQAVVAAIAAEHSLPYACVPAGTRNHFALDLGVDRADVVGALDAFVDGAERIVDLAEVNGRVFVNNVSLGIYGEAVQQPRYRNAKLRTLLDTIPDAMDAHEQPLRWTGPDGEPCESRANVLVSNNAYRLGTPIRAGMRPRLDEGLLGIVVVGDPNPPAWREWTAQTFMVEGGGQIAAGIDGEAAVLQAPLHFRTRPGALRVRLARTHPGASPPAARRRRRGRSRPAWLLDLGRVDSAVYEAIIQTPTPSLDRELSRLTHAADYSRLWLGVAATLAATRGARGRRAAVTGLASVAVSSFVNNLVIKPLSRRLRPDAGNVPPARRAPMPRSTSFPSGHSASAFAFATGVGSVLPREAVPIRALATLVAYSRVHVGVHYPGDVVAGGFLGTTLAQLTSGAIERGW
jgi:diacylglycerol kinase family enzyme/membrane-associated phospholipid phosphatase